MVVRAGAGRPTGWRADYPHPYPLCHVNHPSKLTVYPIKLTKPMQNGNFRKFPVGILHLLEEGLVNRTLLVNALDRGGFHTLVADRNVACPAGQSAVRVEGHSLRVLLHYSNYLLGCLCMTMFLGSYVMARYKIKLMPHAQ